MTPGARQKIFLVDDPKDGAPEFGELEVGFFGDNESHFLADGDEVAVVELEYFDMLLPDAYNGIILLGDADTHPKIF